MRDASLFEPEYRLTLTDDELDALMRPIAEGPGEWSGHQRFEKELQDRVRGRTLVVSDAELAKAYR